MTIDYMLPAEVNFPSDLRRVAVVNNAPLAETSIATNENQFILGAKPEVKTYKGNAFFTAESLAEALAEANYFDEVIVCDSILRASDTELRTDPTLTRNEVIQLTQELDVDFIMAVEDVSLQTSNYLTFIPEWNCFQGVVNMKVSPKINVYIPNRSIPLFAVNARDSIYWEQLGTTESYVRGNIIKKDQFIREGSIFAGIAPIKHLLPHWNSATRYLYTSGSVHMRDATIYLNENNWEEAFKLWNETYQIGRAHV